MMWSIWRKMLLDESRAADTIYALEKLDSPLIESGRGLGPTTPQQPPPEGPVLTPARIACLPGEHGEDKKKLETDL
jgi:hypothetical protein